MSDYFLGEIRLFTCNYAPQGWAQCDGQILQVTQNQALFSLIGNQFGGTAPTSFALPDMRGRIPIGSNTTAYKTGAKGGVETVSLTVAQIPSHSHALTASVQTADNVDPTGVYMAAVSNDSAGGAAPSIYAVAAGNPVVPLVAKVIPSVGASGPHNNMQPFSAVNFCIALVGLYPSRQ